MNDNEWAYKMVAAFGIWIVIFHGEPDLLDAVIHWLMK